MESSNFDTASLTGPEGTEALGVVGDIAVAVLKIVAASLGGS